MDMTNIMDELNNIEVDQFGLNRLLLNLILQIFLKNNIDDPNDIMSTISEYIDIPINSPIIASLASQLNIMNLDNNWIWIVN